MKIVHRRPAAPPMNGWEETAVKRTVGAEHRDDLAVALLVSLGYADSRPRAPGRRPISATVFRERVPAS